ncbi:MAG: hypothetical protein K1X94_00130 [Sandaracinaceae bacterium]|nr:hypothetical protein [Sandaracinaceae bacterium]
MRVVEAEASSETWSFRDRASDEGASEGLTSDGRCDVAELVALMAVGLGPVACFAVFGTGSGIEMGLGAVVAVAAARALALTLRPGRFHDALERERVGYRIAAGPSAQADAWDEEG